VNSMRNVRSMLPVLLLTAGGCFGQCNPYPLRPSILPPCQSLAKQAWDAARDFKKAEAALNGEVGDARSRFWKVFPNGPGFEAAQAAFLGELTQKDLYYLMFALQQGMTGDVTKMANAIQVTADPFGLDPTTPRDLNQFPTNVDGGIRPFAMPMFAAWVNALRRAEGREKDGQWASPVIIAEAYLDKSNWRKTYEDARNWAEFLSSGLDISKYVTPQVYLVNQMESTVTISLAHSKPADLPDPKASSLDLYNLFVKTFGEKDVLAAASSVLHTPKNSIGGLAKRADVVIGAYEPAPSPDPFLLFLTQVTNSSPRNYAIALCLDQTALQVSGHATETVNSKEQWAKAVSVYGQLVARFGEPAVVAAAGRLKDVPKDDRGGPRGDPESKGAIYWFTALLKDPKTPLPDMAHFLASSYDPRWIGKVVEVRGTVSRVDLDTNGSPRYATIHFKDAKNDRFTAFTPNSEILDSYGQNFSGLVGKPIDIWGQVQDWREGAGIRFLLKNQLKVLDAGALANFRESAPDWMSGAARSTVDSPEYLAWKKFQPGSKASYVNDSLHEFKPGTNQYTKTRISALTLTLESIDDERAVVKMESTVSGKVGGRNNPDTHSSDQRIIRARRIEGPGAPMDDPTQIVTRGEETLVINGKQISTRWECVTRANDPMTFTKKWTSADVPGGLVRTQQQSHSQIVGQTYRDIQQTLYAPVDGVEPQLGGASSPSPSPSGSDASTTPGGAADKGAATNPPQPPPTSVASQPRGRPNPSATSPDTQAEFMKHYGAVMTRAAQDRASLAQAIRKLSVAGVALPDEIRDAQTRLTSQQQSVALAMRARDNVAGEQSLRDMEDTLAVIEKLISK
jgi:hypothetical protein